MNDRLSSTVIAAVTRGSPGYLLQELGLERVMVLRPHTLMERSGVVTLADLDDNVRDCGRGFILRPVREDKWAAIRIFDQHYGYRLWWIEFNCTTGHFFFGLTRNRGRRAFVAPAVSIQGVTLRHVRRRDII